MIELRKLLPRKSSRTRTHAITVPTTAFTEAISVRRSAAQACGFEIAVQNPSAPPLVERMTTAASGISAITLRYETATPRARAAPGRVALEVRGGGPATASLAGGSGLPLVLEDLRDDPLLRIEELVVHLAPAPELVDLEELRRDRVGLGVGQARVDRAVALLGEDL